MFLAYIDLRFGMNNMAVFDKTVVPFLSNNEVIKDVNINKVEGFLNTLGDFNITF